jgi:hypothetical protein
MPRVIRGPGCPGTWPPDPALSLRQDRQRNLAQAVVDGARAEEKLRRDLAVGQAVGHEPGDLQLLRGEPGHSEGVALAGGLAGGAQLALGAPGSRSGSQSLNSSSAA